jgi:hypothetical protein
LFLQIVLYFIFALIRLNSWKIQWKLERIKKKSKFVDNFVFVNP